MNSVPAALRGRTEPRLWTPPLRELNEESSYGFDVIWFARHVLGMPLDPWQQWLVIHAGELLPDGRPRFKNVLVLVARQNGKTHLLVVLALFWLFVEKVAMVLGTSTNLDVARESWEKAVDLATANELLSLEVPKTGVRRANGEQTLTTVDRCRYKIAASNRKGGRGLTIHRLILDELREHDKWDAWNAAVPATNAVPNAQVWALSNMGDDKSIVLDSLRNSALQTIKTGQGDMRTGIFEWSAPDGSKPTDLDALAMANPNLGHRIDVDSLLGDAARAEAAGGQELTGFLTEILCMRVKSLDPAIDGEKWAAPWSEGGCLDPESMENARDRIALCVDLSIDGRHASLVAAAVLPDGRVRVEAIAAWSGEDCTRQLRQELPGWVTKVKPRVLGWFPNGPAAAVAADLADRKQRGAAWPPPRVKVEAIGSETTSVCMGFAEQVHTGQVAHSDDPVLNQHVANAEKLRRGDAWVFTRRGAGHCDATYAAAGAVHLARTLPPPPPRLLVMAPAQSIK